MDVWDKLFGTKDGQRNDLKPAVQRDPPPAPAPAPSRETSRRTRETARRSVPDRETSRKKAKERETSRKTREPEDEAFVKRGLKRQAEGDYAGAVEEFNRAIELNPECAKAWEGRGVSREVQGDMEGARADYAKSIGIQVRAEIARQLRDNPDVML